MTAILRAEGLKVWNDPYASPAVDIDEITVEAGECLVLLGANGAGKSTLAMTMGLLRRHHEGRIWILGEESTWTGRSWTGQARLGSSGGRKTRDGLRRRIASLLQNHALFSGTVADNVSFGLADGAHGAAAQNAMERLGIAELAHRDVSTLSGGEARRTAVAAVLSRDPELVLMDEPTDGLDEAARTSLMRDLGRIRAESGLSMVIVTHRRLEAVALADRIAVMRGGRFVQIGPIDDVLANPADADTADFLGFENLLPGRVIASDNSLTGLTTIQLRGGIQVEAVGEIPPGRNVIVGIRSDDITLIAGGPAPRESVSARNRIFCRVEQIEPRWSVVCVRLRPIGTLVSDESRHEHPLEQSHPRERDHPRESDHPVMSSLITRRSCADLDLKPGAEISALFKAVNVRVWERGNTE